MNECARSIDRQLATTLKGVTPAVVTADTLAMGFLAIVITSFFQPLLLISTSLPIEDTTSTKKYHQYVTFSCAVHR